MTISLAPRRRRRGQLRARPRPSSDRGGDRPRAMPRRPSPGHKSGGAQDRWGIGMAARPVARLGSGQPLDRRCRRAIGVQLSADRATMADRSVVLDEQSAPVVVRIAEALDGLPMALEMAAASLRSLNLGELLDGIHSNVLETASERRSGAARQRTLSAMVEWSYRAAHAGGAAAVRTAQRLRQRFRCGCGGARGRGWHDAGFVARDDPAASRTVTGRPGRRRTGRPLPPAGHGPRCRAAPARQADGRPHASRAGRIGRRGGRAVRAGRGSGDELTGLLVLDAERPNLLAALAVTVEAPDITSLGRLAVALTPVEHVATASRPRSRSLSASRPLGF